METATDHAQLRKPSRWHAAIAVAVTATYLYVDGNPFVLWSRLLSPPLVLVLLFILYRYLRWAIPVHRANRDAAREPEDRRQRLGVAWPAVCVVLVLSAMLTHWPRSARFMLCRPAFLPYVEQWRTQGAAFAAPFSTGNLELRELQLNRQVGEYFVERIVADNNKRELRFLLDGGSFHSPEVIYAEQTPPSAYAPYPVWLWPNWYYRH